MPDQGNEQDRALEALRSADAYPHTVGNIEVVETHISWVFLTGELAYKVKKAIRLPFVDFSSLERRERFCRDELRLNQRLAPDLYLEVVPIGGTPGALRVGAEPAVEYAVRMKQFPADATADRLLAADALDEAQFAAFGRSLAAFHDTLPPSSAPDPAAIVLRNLEELEALDEQVDRPALEPVAKRIRQDSRRLAPLFQARARGGFVRECHGDLHTGNLALIEGTLTAFDCLEFDIGLRTIDVADEVAFLFMDLEAHTRPDLGFAFLNAYLEAGGDFEGLGLLRYYAAHRALVRAKVAALTAAEKPSSDGHERALRYLDAAARLCHSDRTRLMLTFGLSGSGKTTVARALAGKIQAIHLRSDVERKRLHGLAASERSHSGLGRGIYDEDASAATYRRLAEATEAALAGGLDVIVDASFLARPRREMFRSIADEHESDFVILACTASEQVLRERIERREQAANDASEASTAVLDHQLDTMSPLAADEQPHVLEVDTEAGPEPAELARAVLKRRYRRPRTGR